MLSGKHHVTVLIVDDAKLVRERLSKRLATIEGVEIAGHAGSVPEAMNAVRLLHPDAVVLDIQMPGGTGIDVLEEIKKEVPGTTVIMLTNYPLPQIRRRCLLAGAAHFFDKTCEFEKVADVLKGLVAGRRHPDTEIQS